MCKFFCLFSFCLSWLLTFLNYLVINCDLSHLFSRACGEVQSGCKDTQRCLQRECALGGRSPGRGVLLTGLLAHFPLLPGDRHSITAAWALGDFGGPPLLRRPSYPPWWLPPRSCLLWFPSPSDGDCCSRLPWQLPAHSHSCLRTALSSLGLPHRRWYAARSYRVLAWLSNRYFLSLLGFGVKGEDGVSV